MSSGIFRRRELQCHQSESPLNDRSSYVARHLSELDVLSAVGAVINASKGRGVSEFVHCEDTRATWLDAIDRALLERHLVRLLQLSPSLEDARQYVCGDSLDKTLDVYTSSIHYTVFALMGPVEELLLRPGQFPRALYSAREKTLPVLMSWLLGDKEDCCVLNGVERNVLDGLRSTVLQDREATRTSITERLCALENDTLVTKATHIPETFICDTGDVCTVGVETFMKELKELRRLYNSSPNGVDSPVWEDTLDPSLHSRVYSGRNGQMEYQWLPTDFRVGDDGDVTALSPLHGSVHPRDFPSLYTAIPRFLERLLPLFECVLGSIATPSPPVSYDVGLGSTHASNCTVRTNEPIKEYKLRGRQLQVVVKLSTVRLNKAHPMFTSDLDRQFNRGWKQESDSHEHIIAVGYYVVRSRNITPPKLSFRAFTHCPEDASFASHKDSFLAFGERTSAYYGGRYGRQFLQPWGSLALHEGRSIAVPNFLVHRVEPFELCNSSDPEGGELVLATFYLVDPSEKSIVSTRTVRPDQWQQTQSFVRANVDMLRCCSSIPFFPDEIANRIVCFVSNHVSEHHTQLYRQELLAHRRKMQELRFLTPSLRLSEMKLDLDSEGTTTSIGGS